MHTGGERPRRGAANERCDVFVLGMDAFNRATLERLPEAGRYRFHPLLTTQQVRRAAGYDFDRLLDAAARQLDVFPGSIEAITTWWDFPATGLAAALSRGWELPGPDLAAVLTLEHKYWSRLVQQSVAASHIPAFAVLDPFDGDALSHVIEQGISFPFWVKPVKAVGSYLGFRIESRADFEVAMATMRAGIGLFGDPLQQALDRIEAPPAVASAGGRAAIAEQIIGGQQCTLEGYVSAGKVATYGVVDSHREPGRSTFSAYIYPSQLPVPIQRHMADIATAVVTAAGLDHCCFNAEFYYESATDQLWLLEVNTRLSQSHCELFAAVDGVSSQRAMLEVAQGRSPHMPHRQGAHRVAGKHFLRAHQDGVVRRVPDEAELARVARCFPDTRIVLEVRAGDRLGDLPVQESYSYELGYVLAGAESHERLVADVAEITTMLPVEIDTDPNVALPLALHPDPGPRSGGAGRDAAQGGRGARPAAAHRLDRAGTPP